MHEVMTELMMALWSHLRPSPIQFGKKVGECPGSNHHVSAYTAACTRYTSARFQRPVA